jgi:hypothetical protein
MATDPRMLPEGSKPTGLTGGPDVADLTEDPELKRLLGASLTPNDDGSVTVDESGEEGEAEDDEQQEAEFYDNLAEDLADTDRRRLASQLLEQVELDRDARDKRDKDYAQALKKTGLGNDWPGNSDIEGATDVVHPVLAEGCVDFSARVIREILPPDRAVKYKIRGKVTPAKEARARRKVEHMNWQLLVESDSFRPEVEKLETQLPLSGNGYLKVWFDKSTKRFEFEFVPQDKVYLPYAARSFYSAERVTQVLDLTKLEFEDRVSRGLYREGQWVSQAMAPDASAAEQANQRVEGVAPDPYNKDGVRRLYEVRCLMRPEWDPAAPDHAVSYMVTVDESTRDLVALRRNWDRDEWEEDETYDTLHHLHEFCFIRWRGAYGVGLTHILAGLPVALTGALRALLDSAHVNNLPTLLKLKGRPGGADQMMVGTGVTEIDGEGVDDIRNVVMHVPFNPPSEMLFQLLQWLDDKAKGVVRTSLDDVTPGPGNTTTPVGTELSRVEQGLTVFSSIFGRQHNSMGRVYETVHRLNKLYLDEEVSYQQGDSDDDDDSDDNIALRADYDSECDMVPVSDPRVFTDQQRMARYAAVDQLAALGRPIDLEELTKRELDLLGLDEPDKLILKKPAPTFQNQVAENVAMSLGQPVMAFPQQNHLAHLQVMFKFFEDPTYGGNPLIAPRFVPAATKHSVEHLLLYYADQCDEIAKQATGGIDPTSLVDPSDPDLVKQLDALTAAAANAVHSHSQQLAPLLKIMQQLAQQASQMAQQQAQQAQAMNADPAAAMAAHAAMAETQRKAQKDQADGQRADVKAGTDAKSRAQDNATKITIAQSDQQSRERMNTQDNLTALTIAGGELDSGEKANVSDGHGLDKNPIPR